MTVTIARMMVRTVAYVCGGINYDTRRKVLEGS